MVFKGTTGVYERIYCFISKWIRKKEKYANSKWILRNLFCCWSNLSNHDIISKRPGLRVGMNFRRQVWKRVWKLHFLVSNMVSIWRTGWQPHQEFPGYTPSPPPLPGARPKGLELQNFNLSVCFHLFGRITKAEHFNISFNIKLEILCYLNRIIHFQ